MLANRLKKRFKHLKKWAKRNEISCFRVYEKDIPEFPLILDWYDGEIVIWLHRRKKDENEQQHDDFRKLCLAEIQEAFNLAESKVHLKERRRQSHDGQRSQYEKIAKHEEKKIIEEGSLKFEVNLKDYLDTGLFLDHRIARNEIRKLSKDLRVLNLFAYTGSFSVYAMDGFAKHVTTVDMSHTYLDWAKRNMKHNGLYNELKTEFIAMDCLNWLEEAIQFKMKYDLIICDPPTFSNSKRMKESSFSIDRDHEKLLSDIHKLLNEGGSCLFSNNSRSFKMNHQKLESLFSIEEWSHKSQSEDFRNDKIHRSWWLKKI